MTTLHMRFETENMRNNKNLTRPVRIANRGILLNGSKILLSYEDKRDIWMIPGGGMEPNERNDDGCIREFEEETGIIVEIEDLVVKIREYYDSIIHENNYYVVKKIGNGEQALTDDEKENGLVAKWIELNEAAEIFSKYEEYDESDCMKCCIYRREYNALSHFKMWLEKSEE